MTKYQIFGSALLLIILVFLEICYAQEKRFHIEPEFVFDKPDFKELLSNEQY